ncbi:MAG: HAMP domain-containing histidine kinase [Colwellia sp.]|nr:HAMP domain-containing histidine kinase [Colwellia sp.]
MRLSTSFFPHLAIVRFIKNKLRFSSLYKTENRWAILLGILVLIPFLSISTLGLHSYKIMGSARTIERFERSEIEIKMFQQQLSQQLTKLTQYFNKIVFTTHTDNGFDGLRHLVNNEPLFALIASFSKNSPVLFNSEQTISHVEKAILTDTMAEIIWAQDYLLQQQANSVWSPVRSIIGNAYLYCWRQQINSGFCILLPTVELYKKLWQSQRLQQANQNIHIQDSFMQNVGVNQAVKRNQSSTMINIDGFILNLSASLEKGQHESTSELWLILAMTLPLLGLAIAIAWMIFISHSKQTRMAKKLLHGTQEIAHELRTPLSNVSLYIGLILHKKSTKQQLEHGEIINSEMQRITRIIDNATALMRGNQPEQYEYGNPSGLLNELANQYRLSLAQSGCILTVQCTITLNYFYPKRAVEHVLLNLLNNAKKYAPGQQVILGLACQNNILSVWVKNHVVNVSALDANKTHLKQVSGLGLGLMSCKRLVKSLGGDFECTINKNGRCYRANFPLREESNPCLN